MINKKESIFSQIVHRGITDERIINAFMKVARENFVLEEFKLQAYLDSALPIMCSQSISQPYIVALMTKMLNCKEDGRVLEIGTGSGYQAAILSCLVREVVSFEIIDELCKFAENNLKKSEIENVKIVNVDGGDFFDESYRNYFDRILVTARNNKICDVWKDYLKEGGFLVMPFGEEDLQILKKYRKDKGELILVEESQVPVRFVPLTGKYGV